MRGNRLNLESRPARQVFWGTVYCTVQYVAFLLYHNCNPNHILSIKNWVSLDYLILLRPNGLKSPISRQKKKEKIGQFGYSGGVQKWGFGQNTRA